MVNSYANILRVGTQAKYNTLETKDPTMLYFCTDTGKLYKGSVDFTDSMVVAASKPATPIAGKIYFLADTNTVEVYVSGAWKVISYPTVNTVDITSDDVHVASAKAVYDAIQAAVEDLATSANIVKDITSTEAATLKIKKGNDTEQNLTLNGVVTKPTWDSANRVLTIPVTGEGASDVVVNIGKDLHIDHDAENGYNEDTKCIDVYLNDGDDSTASTKISIPVSGLVDIYTSEATSSATVEVTSDNKIKASVKIDSDEKNAIKVTTDGLKVDLSELATIANVGKKITAVTTAVEDAQTDATDALTQIDVLNGDVNTEGSIDKKISVAKEEIFAITNGLDSRVNKLETRMTATEKNTSDNATNITSLATAITTWKAF